MEEKFMRGKRDLFEESDIIRAINTWEYNNSLSFIDVCDFSQETNGNFLKFIEEKYPKIYNHCREELSKNYIKDIVYCCDKYFTELASLNNPYFYNSALNMSLCPLAEFIINDDGAWDTFIGFLKENIVCY